MLVLKQLVLKKQRLIGRMFINIYFKTVIYDSKKEKRKYEIEMSEEKLKIC